MATLREQIHRFALLTPAARGSLQLDVLDGLRGLAVLWVVFGHLANANLVLLPVKFAGEGSGQQGVILFFILSGFLLTRALLVQLDAGKPRLWRHYALRRVRRIFPLYLSVLVMLVFATRADWEIFSPITWHDVWRHLTLRAGDWHLWTITAELKFYLALPFLVLAFHRWGRVHPRQSVTIMVTLCFLAAGATVVAGVEENWSLLRHAPSFAIGTGLAMWRHVRPAPLTAAQNGIARIATYAALAAMLLSMPNTVRLLTGLGYDGWGVWLVPGLLAGWPIVVGVFFVGMVVAPPRTLERLLTWTPMRVIGALSFSIYLNHWFMIEACRNLPLSIGSRIALVWAATLLGSVLTFGLIERPFLRPRR